MYCPHCGKVVTEGARYCTACGCSITPGMSDPLAGLANDRRAVTPATPLQPRQVDFAAPASPTPVPPRPIKPKKKKGCLAALFIGGAVLVLGIAIVLAVLFFLPADKDLPVATPAPTTAQPTRTPSPTSTAAPTPTPTPTPTPAPTAAAPVRDDFGTILGNGEDVFTILIYMVGSDLESEAGCATSDLEEILAATLPENVNVLIETGGALSWERSGVSTDPTRWIVENGDLAPLQIRRDAAILTESELADFIRFAAKTAPANRYGLVFWDHGGGPLYGYGYDELNPDDVLYLDDITSALAQGGVTFDFIGFDACLMGSLEIACALEPYADYYIASQDYIPGYGWDYTAWLTALGQNTSMPTAELGAAIVDSYIAHNSQDDCLSVLSLPYAPQVNDLLGTYLGKMLLQGETIPFSGISQARADTKRFGSEEYDLVDLKDLLDSLHYPQDGGLRAALDGLVAYKNESQRQGVGGVSIYFPYYDLESYEYALELFALYADGTQDFYTWFVESLLAGQFSEENSTAYQTAREEVLAVGHEFTAEDALYLYWSEADNGYILPMSEDAWLYYTQVESSVLYDDGEGYIDLGIDQYFTLAANESDLLVTFDGTWVAIGGQHVCYYATENIYHEDGSVSYLGVVPAMRNGEEMIDIYCVWGSDSPDGEVLGYRLQDEPSDTVGKGYRSLQPGDTLDFVCEYYDYDLNYDGSYYFGETFVVGDAPLAVGYESVGSGTTLVSYVLTDIYQNEWWTEWIEESFD